MTNCKPGDLAVVVRVTNEDIRPFLGRVLRCVRLSTSRPDCWFTEPELTPRTAVYDGALRPIRDQPGADETLTWADKQCDIKTPEAA